MSAKKAPAKKDSPASKKTAAAKQPAAAKKSAAPKKAAASKTAAKPKSSSSMKTAAAAKNPAAARKKTAVEGSGGFTPYQEKKGEEYMSDGMKDHFRKMLHACKRELMEEVDRTVHHMQDEAANFPAPSDRATHESEFTMELRTRYRERELIKKIDESL